MATATPYLLFSGNCEEAFNHYKSVFGGEFSGINRYKEMPPQEGEKIPDAYAEQIMHMALPLSKTSFLLGSDSHPTAPKIKMGNNFSISINTASKADADKFFKGLSSGGTVKMPMEQTFWGDYFGMCEDKFGVHWMIGYNEKNPG